MTFRFNAKYVLLTYAQCGELDPFLIVNLLGELGGECVVGRENHADGGIHLHAFCMFEKKFSTRNARVFDIESHHPNILSGIRAPSKAWDYATKDGDVCAGGLERPTEATNTKHHIIAAILAETTRDGLLERARELDPGLYVRNYFQLRAIAEERDSWTPRNYITPTGLEFTTELYPELADWLSSYLGRRGER